MKERKLTVIGEADPIFLTVKLRKFGFTELLSVSSEKEEKEAEGEKKEEKKADPPNVVYVNPSRQLRALPIYCCYRGLSSQFLHYLLTFYPLQFGLCSIHCTI